MSRVAPDAFGGKSVVLVFIAGSVREAERVEATLTAARIDYCLDAEEFIQGMLSSTRAGLEFYVLEGQVSFARRELAEAQLQSGLIDADS